MPFTDLSSRQHAFRSHVRRALLHLYDPAHLRRSPLIDLLGISTPTDKVFTLREVIQKAIQALKPEHTSGTRPQARLIYQILNYRYLEQMSQKEVAAELAISLRQIQRMEAVALDTLSLSMLNDYHVRLEDIQIEEELEEDAEESDALPANEIIPPIPNDPLLKELEWVRQSGTLETVDFPLFLEQILSTTAALFAARGITISPRLPQEEIQITGNLMALRQGFINILTTLAGGLPPGPLPLIGSLQEDQGIIQIPTTADSQWAVTDGSQERIEMAGQLFKIGGGQLDIRSSGSGGSDLFIRLPAARRLVVLAVDDNADALTLVTAYLSKIGAQVHGIRDPLLTLPSVETIKPHIILLDVMLPGMDGWQILGRLKHHPQAAQIPVIISTILPQADLAFSLGADGFLRKPFTQEELVALVSQLTRTGLKLP